MAFGVTATVGSDSINLHNDAPFSIRSIRGAGGVNIRRVTIQGPAQDGDTDKGYRLGTRDLELTVIFKAVDDATLDGYRDTLTSFFKPLTHTPVKLRITRDDAAVRQIDCYPRGTSPVDIRLVPELRPGHTHQATISLRAADSPWYNPTQGSAGVIGTSFVGATWWLAGGAIGTAQVMEHGTAPTQGQAWTYTGTPDVPTYSGTSYLGGYTIAFRSGREPLTHGKFAFFAGDGSDGTPSVSFRTYLTNWYAYGNGVAGKPTYSVANGSVGMPVGTSNFFITHQVADSLDIYSGTIRLGGNSGQDVVMGGTARRWRSDATNSVGSRWTEALEKYAVYVPQLNSGQLAALDYFMNIPAGQTSTQYIPVAYDGNLPEYPQLSITGPVTGPSITNLATGHTLDFGTITIGAGTTYLINTHPQFKTVLMGTVNKRGELTADSDLDAFHISPNATGGTNVFFLDGTAMGTATALAITWYNRYSSF